MTTASLVFGVFVVGIVGAWALDALIDRIEYALRPEPPAPPQHPALKAEAERRELERMWEMS